MINSDFEERAERYAASLPGIVRATLVDFGISGEVIDRRKLGWDGELVTVPLRSQDGRLCSFELWDVRDAGIRIVGTPFVELFGGDTLEAQPARVIVAEGIHEALVFESLGILAVAASGTGRFFKEREWVPRLRAVPEVVLAYKRGERTERRRFLLSREDVRLRASRSLPHARVLDWPKEVGRDGGAVSFFVEHRHSVEDFEELVQRS